MKTTLILVTGLGAIGFRFSGYPRITDGTVESTISLYTLQMSALDRDVPWELV